MAQFRTLGKTLALGALASLALSLSGCSDHALVDLREAQYSGTAFDQALAMEYRLLAEDEAAAYHWDASNLFAEKGLKTAYGQAVLPEEPEKHALKDQQLAMLQEARTELLALADDEHRASQPKILARAWSQYECWVVYAAKNPEGDDALNCHENFDIAVKQLTPDPSESAKKAEVPAFGEPERNPSVAEAVENKQQAFYVLLFRLNSSQLNTSGLAKLREIAAELKDKTDWNIMLNGHTDRSGPDDFNMQLSARRADAVKAALIDQGLDAARIQTFAFGETDPAVPTADGVKEPANRRVEILLN